MGRKKWSAHLTVRIPPIPGLNITGMWIVLREAGFAAINYGLNVLVLTPGGNPNNGRPETERALFITSSSQRAVRMQEFISLPHSSISSVFSLAGSIKKMSPPSPGT